MMGYDESLQKVKIKFELIKNICQIIKEGEADSAADEWVDTHHFDGETELAAKELDEGDLREENKVYFLQNLFI